VGLHIKNNLLEGKEASDFHNLFHKLRPVTSSLQQSSVPVAIVYDRHRLFLDAVETVLTGPEIAIAAKATTPEETIRELDRHRADLLIVGLGSADDVPHVASVVREAVAGRRGLKVIVLATSPDVDVDGEIFEAGAAAFVGGNGSHDDVSFAIRQTTQPSIHFAPPPRPRPRRVQAPTTALTDRELEILRLVAQGHSNAEVASALWVTEQTVKFHLGNTFRKLGVTNRTQASRRAHQLGLVPGDEPDVEASAVIPA
jgi:DNA-binding NarL/FixJ family response regulator